MCFPIYVFRCFQLFRRASILMGLSYRKSAKSINALSKVYAQLKRCFQRKAVAVSNRGNPRNTQPKGTAVRLAADLAFDLELGAMALRYVFHDGEAEAGAAGFAGA